MSAVTSHPTPGWNKKWISVYEKEKPKIGRKVMVLNKENHHNCSRIPEDVFWATYQGLCEINGKKGQVWEVMGRKINITHWLR